MSVEMISLKELLAKKTTEAAPELIRDEGQQAVRCLACGHRCRVLPGRDGVCRIRFNRDGVLRVPHGYVSSVGVDPIEKKPFYHAFPGEGALSFGMLGCDFHCGFCQNWITSQVLRDQQAIQQPQFAEPEEIVALAREHGCRVLTSTYNEPLITSEWAVEIFKRGKEAGLRGSFVSNGHGTPEVLAYLRPYVDLFNIDLKAFRDKTYRKLGGVLENVVETIREAHRLGFWVEIVTLVVPDMNDSDEELREMAEFIASVSPDMPWHVTAFRPMYKMSEPPRTSPQTLLRAVELGREAGLRFVYAGNLPGLVGDGEDTKCPLCGKTLVERRGFSVRRNHMNGSACPGCAARIPGVWE